MCQAIAQFRGLWKAFRAFHRTLAMHQHPKPWRFRAVFDDHENRTLTDRIIALVDLKLMRTV